MKGMRQRTRKGLFWLVAAAAIAVIVFVGRSFKAVSVPGTVVQAREAVETVLAAGRVVGEKSVPLSFVRPGRIADEFIRDGDAVPADFILIRQDGRHEERALAQARIALEEARLRREKLRTTDLPEAEEKVRQAKANDAFTADYFKRQTELYEQKALTQLQFEQGRRDRELAASVLASAENQLRSFREVQSAQADLAVARAESELKKAELDVLDTFLKAPATGRIVSHDAHPGEFVQAGQKIVTFIPAASRTRVEIQVDEANAGRIKIGQKAAVSSPAFPGQVFSAEVERLGAMVDAQRGSFPVRLILDGFEADLLPESSVSIQIELGREPGLLILEQRFLLQENGKTAVFVAEGRRARKIFVSARDLGNGQFECREGLRNGQIVLLPQGMRDGLRIKPVLPPE